MLHSADVVTEGHGMEQRQARSAEDITHWLLDKLAAILDTPSHDLDTSAQLMEYGLSSAEAAILAGDLEDWLGCVLPPTLAWEYPTIDALAHYLAAVGETREPAATGAEQTTDGLLTRIPRLPYGERTITELLREMEQ